LARRFIKRELLQDITPFKLTKSDPDEQKNCVSACHADIGLGFESVLKTLQSKPSNRVGELSAMEFRRDCITVLSRILKKIQEKSPLKYPAVREIAFLDPSNMTRDPKWYIVQNNGCYLSVADTTSDAPFHHINAVFNATWLLPEQFITEAHTVNDSRLPLRRHFRATLEVELEDKTRKRRRRTSAATQIEAESSSSASVISRLWQDEGVASALSVRSVTKLPELYPSPLIPPPSLHSIRSSSSYISRHHGWIPAAARHRGGARPL
ncbi:hypothetical protein AMECASPLE_032314, partial [Ameca splendens]